MHVNDAAAGCVQPLNMQSTNEGLVARAASMSGPTRIDAMSVSDAHPVARCGPNCSSPAFGNQHNGGQTLEASLVAACATSSPAFDSSPPLLGHAAPEDAFPMGSPTYGRRLRQSDTFQDLGRTLA